MIYVTMTDTFMSGWGEARGLINKLIFECETREQAEVVYQNALNRTDTKYVNMTSKKPYYSPSKYYAQTMTIKDYPDWYVAGRF